MRCCARRWPRTDDGRLTQFLWERPCVAIGPQSGPGNSEVKRRSLGALRTPIATQGRSHKDRERRISVCLRRTTTSNFDTT